LKTACLYWGRYEGALRKFIYRASNFTLVKRSSFPAYLCTRNEVLNPILEEFSYQVLYMPRQIKNYIYYRSFRATQYENWLTK